MQKVQFLVPDMVFVGNAHGWQPSIRCFRCHELRLVYGLFTNQQLCVDLLKIIKTILNNNLYFYMHGVSWKYLDCMKRYRLDFCHQGLEKDPRELKSDPEFIKIREEVLSLIWSMEEETAAHTG